MRIDSLHDRRLYYILYPRSAFVRWSESNRRNICRVRQSFTLKTSVHAQADAENANDWTLARAMPYGRSGELLSHFVYNRRYSICRMHGPITCPRPPCAIKTSCLLKFRFPITIESYIYSRIDIACFSSAEKSRKVIYAESEIRESISRYISRCRIYMCGRYKKHCMYKLKL